MKHRVYWVFEHILKEYVFSSCERSYIKDLTKIVREEIKKSSRTISDLFANNFVYILNLVNKLRTITLQQLV